MRGGGHRLAAQVGLVKLRLERATEGAEGVGLCSYSRRERAAESNSKLRPDLEGLLRQVNDFD